MSIQKSDDLRQVCHILIEFGELLNELNRLVQRIRKLQKTDEKKAVPEYLHLFTEVGSRMRGFDDEEEEEEEEWQGRVKFLQATIDRVEMNVRKEVQDEIQRLTRRQRTILDKQESMNQKINRIHNLVYSNQL